MLLLLVVSSLSPSQFWMLNTTEILRGSELRVCALAPRLVQLVFNADAYGFLRIPCEFVSGHVPSNVLVAGEDGGHGQCRRHGRPELGILASLGGGLLVGNDCEVGQRLALSRSGFARALRQ